MAQFSDLVFVPTGDNQGFEAGFYDFGNYWQIQVVCGKNRYTLTPEEREDVEVLASADLYNAFDYKIYDGVNTLDDTHWVGGQTKDQITAIMQDIEGRAQVYGNGGE